MIEKNKTLEYWDENIETWGDFYLNISHSNERFNSPHWFESIYRMLIMPIESRLMKQRYALTLDFITNHIQPGLVAVDVGCGTGIFTVEMLKRGALVRAVDYSQHALNATKSLVEKVAPEHADKVEYILMDVSKALLPKSDVVLAMGVTPYLEDLSIFYENVLPTTNILFCLIIDPYHWANIIRQVVPLLNVRTLHWFRRADVDALYKKYNWKLERRENFGSGYLDLVFRSA